MLSFGTYGRAKREGKAAPRTHPTCEKAAQKAAALTRSSPFQAPLSLELGGLREGLESSACTVLTSVQEIPGQLAG